jgi:hypothetical protein
MALGLVFVTGALAVLPAPASAQLVSGLQGASGSTIGPDGAIYATEGAAGRVTRVDPVTGDTSTLVSGLPPSIIGIGGAVDVAFIGGTAYVLVTLVGDPLVGAGAVDGIYRVDGPSELTVVADIGAWSASHPPTGFGFFLVNGVQYALEEFRGGFLVTDGHHNRVLEVGLDGEISEFATFGNIVPTGLEVQGNTVYMAETGPAPHEPEDGRVVALDAKSGAAAATASGARMIVDVERGRGQTLYALAQGVWDGVMPGSPALPFTGSLVQVNEDGSLTELVNSLNIPTSLELIGNTAYVVTLTGDIWVIPDVSSPPYGKARGRND